MIKKRKRTKVIPVRTSIPASSGRDTSLLTTERFRQTREHHALEAAEDYVELIDDLIRECGEARLVDIARRIGVSHVTANQTVRRLQRQGLVQKEPYRAIFLTDRGRKMATESRQRHRIVLRFLLAIGVPERQANIDAEGIEHHISRVTLKVMESAMRSLKPAIPNTLAE
ncbi:MAG: manganese-binding transcriptional regulator MntR [Planctomycetota bacterium]